MYSTTVLFAVLILVSSTALKQEIYRLPPHRVLAARKISIPCEKEHNVDSSYLTKIADGTLQHDDETSKKYLYCFTFNGGFVDEGGHVIVEKTASYLGAHPLVEEFKESLRNCNKITKENHLETVMAMNACIKNTSPVVFSL